MPQKYPKMSSEIPLFPFFSPPIRVLFPPLLPFACLSFMFIFPPAPLLPPLAVCQLISNNKIVKIPEIIK